MSSFILKTSFLICIFSMLQNTVFAQVHDKARKQPSDVATDSKPTDSKDTDKTATKPKKEAEAVDFERWYYGGNLGFNGTNGGFAVNVSPLVGYRLKPKLMVGGGIICVGVSSGVSKGKINETAIFGQYGLRAFTRYDVLKGVFAHAELSQAWNSIPVDIDQNNKVVYKITPLPSALTGLGVNLGAGPIRFNATVLYNLLYGLYDADQLGSNQTNYNGYTSTAFPGWQIQGGVGYGF
jgi:hypothetical protein